MLSLLVPIIVLQIFASDLDGAAFYIASTVNILLAAVGLYITFTCARRANELRQARQERRGSR